MLSIQIIGTIVRIPAFSGQRYVSRKWEDIGGDNPTVAELLAHSGAQVMFKDRFILSADQSHTIEYSLYSNDNGFAENRPPVISVLWGDNDPNFVSLSISGMWRLLEIGKEYIGAGDRDLTSDTIEFLLIKVENAEK